MATERIDIIVSEKGARVVKRNLEDIGGGADTANRSLNLLKRSLQTLSVGLLARETIRLADTYTTIQNRLKTVTSGTEELGKVTEQLFEISNRTRSSFQGTAELYARVGLAAKDLGTSQQELLQFTESLNKAVLLSGASAQEADAAIVQLSQGLASGALRGDELRSVMEQLPAVADVIAKSMGVTRGELRKMGEQGKITAEVVLKAFRQARGELDQNFTKSVATVEQSLQVLRNNVLKLVGEFDTGQGLSKSLADAILFLADNVGLLAKALLVAGAVFGGRFLYGLIASRVAMAASYIEATRLAAGMATATAAAGSNALVTRAQAAAFRIADGAAGKYAASTILVGRNAAAATVGLGSLAASLRLVGAGMLAAFGGPVGLAITAVLIALSLHTNQAVKAQERYNEELMKVQDGFAGYETASDSARRKMIDDANARIEKLIQEAQVLSKLVEGYAEIGQGGFLKRNLGALGLAGQEVFGKLGIGDAPSEIIAKKDALDKTIREMRELVADPLGQNKPGKGGKGAGSGSTEITFDSILQRLKTEGQLLQLNNRERDIQNQMIRVQEQLKRQLTPTEMAYLEAQLQVNQSLEDQARILDEIRAPAVEYQTSLEALNNLMQQGRINSQEYTQSLQDVRLKYLETQTDLASGLERGLLKVNRDLSDAASSMENVVTNAFSNMEDSIVEFAKTGKLNFSSLVDGIISDIIRLQARQAISSIFGGGSGGGGFNLGASILSAVPTFFAKGDVFGSPTAFQYGQGKLGVMGEAGPEAAMPLTRMSDGSLGVRAEGSSQQSVIVTNNVTVNYTASKENGGADSQRVAQMVQQGVEQAMGEFVRKQQKVGGMFNNRVVA